MSGGARPTALGRFSGARTATRIWRRGQPGKSRIRKQRLRELTERALLQQLAPVAALVNGLGDILYLHGRTGLYLEPAPGEAGVTTS